MSRLRLSTPFARCGRATIAAALLFVATGCQVPSTSPDWRATLRDELPRYGHRNFIVIVDAAYPLQVNPGVRTILADGDHLEVVGAVLDAVAASRHVRPVVWLDAEFDLVTEQHAAGVERTRQKTAQRLAGFEVRRAAHEAIIRRLDETADLFEVLVLKTSQVIPYSSVFVELQCGYWTDEAEKALRAAMSREGR